VSDPQTRGIAIITDDGRPVPGAAENTRLLAGTTRNKIKFRTRHMEKHGTCDPKWASTAPSSEDDTTTSKSDVEGYVAWVTDARSRANAEALAGYTEQHLL
jgi:hypothetical protein